MTRSVGMQGACARALLGLLALALALPLATAPQVARAATGDAAMGAASVEAQAATGRVQVPADARYDLSFEVLPLLNQERARHGVKPLRMNAGLLEMAMLRATETAVLFSHIRPDGTLCLTANPALVAENIAAGPWTAASVMASWLNSSGHTSNILNARFSTVGIGCIVHNGVTYWAQCFGTGDATADCPQPANRSDDVEVTITTDPIEDRNSDRVFSLKPELDVPTDLTIGIGERRPLTFSQANPGFTAATTKVSGEGWTSSDPAVARVESGAVTGVGPGSATLACDLGGLHYEVALRVADGVPVYRLYNRWTYEHLYTTSAAERDADVGLGWTFEEIEWYAPETSATPVYRLYNPHNGDHHYTTDPDEYRALVGLGWRGEDAKFFGADASGVPVYRVFNPHNLKAGAHHYLTSATERSRLIDGGWIDEQVGWYGVR